MLIYATGVPIAGFSTNISTMIIARGLQGVGLSMFPITFSIVRDQFPREKMAIGQGIITSMFAGGAVIGLSIGGFIMVAIAESCLNTLFTKVRESSRRRMDPPADSRSI